MEQDDYIPVSQLNKYVFCPRRFYYEYVLGQWQDNIHTLTGTYRHERAHTPGRETRPDQTSSRSITVFSDRLRIIGKMDVLEERKDVLIPVEYKNGSCSEEGPWLNDAVQLCALALCLEERTGKPVQEGALFTFADRQRVTIPFDATLRTETERIIQEAHATAKSEQMPLPVYSSRCEGCSLKSICMPREVTLLAKAKRAVTSLQTMAEMVLQEKSED